MAQSLHWYDVYREIAKALGSWYRTHDKDPGSQLYKALILDTEFKKKNSWIENLKNEWATKSVDPIQLFASFNGSKFPDHKRQERIEILLRLVRGISIAGGTSIDFTGCPQPPIIRLQGSRNPVAQEQIWVLFHNLLKTGADAVEALDWSEIREWRGVGVRSMTIFFFWVDSDRFVPLDKNTLNFLKAYGKLPTKPESKDGYLSLNKEISAQSTTSKNSLFREITRVAYFHNAEDDAQPEYSPRLSGFLGRNAKVSPITFFKLIGIETLPGCAIEHHKILSQPEVFVLDQAFKFNGGRIHYQSEKELNFFTEQDGIKISVEAVVGKNGSGKSTLVELLLRILSNITSPHIDQLQTEDFESLPGVKAAIYYQNQTLEELRKITVLDQKVFITDYVLQDGEFIEKVDEKEREFDFEDFRSFFYSVVVNYSHFSFNSTSSNGDWITPFMHKNDGYQAPAVIAPMRTEGNIDINKENSFAVIRLLAHLFDPVEDEDDSIRNLTDNLTVDRVIFKYEPRADVKEKSRHRIRYEELAKDHPDTIKKILNAVYSIFEFKRGKWNEEESADTVMAATEYIVEKLLKIADVSPIYNQKKYIDPNQKTFDSNELKKYLEKLKNDPSHVTTKLMQAINFLRYPLLETESPFALPVKEFSKKLDGIKDGSGIFEGYKAGDVPNEILLPPPIFQAQIKLRHKNQGEKEREFELLSSGEKQRIHAVSAVLYYLKNLDSVDPNELIQYSSINVILDEIELYYHPEYQRTFLDYLFRMVNTLEFERITGINFLFATHSPYILSDIPDNYVLKLKVGKPDSEYFQTLGANIHDLLNMSFFMKDGVMGEFAKKRIITLIRWLQEKINPASTHPDREKEDGSEFWTPKKARKVIDAIGEPMIRHDLNELYSQAFLQSVDAIDQEIARLEKIKKQKESKDNPNV
jgi:energy-coupling factor transporter ATP-binding protein EcfA2